MYRSTPRRRFSIGLQVARTRDTGYSSNGIGLPSSRTKCQAGSIAVFPCITSMGIPSKRSASALASKIEVSDAWTTTPTGRYWSNNRCCSSLACNAASVRLRTNASPMCAAMLSRSSTVWRVKRPCRGSLRWLNPMIRDLSLIGISAIDAYP